MMAVTDPSGMARETSYRACRRPYQALTPVASNFTAIGLLSLRRHGPRPDGEAGHETDPKHHRQQHQGRTIGVRPKVLIRRCEVRENERCERGGLGVQAREPETAAPRGQEKCGGVPE